jgi:hypothetical protein
MNRPLSPAARDLIKRLIAAVEDSDDWIMYPETLPVVAEAEAWLATPEPAAESSDSLKCCPFCGSSASLSDERLLFVVRCAGCGAVAMGRRIDEPEDGDPEPDWQEMRRSAVVAWNTRTGSEPAAGDPTARDLIQQLADALESEGGYASGNWHALIVKARAYLAAHPEPVAGPIPKPQPAGGRLIRADRDPGPPPTRPVEGKP